MMKKVTIFMMKKVTILLVVAMLLSVNSYGTVTLNPLGISVTETHYTGSSPVAYQTNDTMQIGYNDGQKAKIWWPATTAYGTGPQIADAVSSVDAGLDVAWPADSTTPPPPQAGTNLDIQFVPAYTGGRNLSSINFFIANAGNERSFYDFFIQYQDFTSGVWGDLVAFEEQLDDGNKTVDQASVIELDFAGQVPNLGALRIYSYTSESEFLGWPGHWLATAVQEIDVNLVPEPATFALLGLVGLVAARKRKRS